MVSVPVIDITDLRSPDPELRRAVAKQIGEACETVGFLTVTGHGIDPTVLDDAFTATRKTFAQSMDDKMARAWDDDHVNRGYDPPGRQQLDAESAPDFKEAWSFSPEHLAGIGPMSGENQWPALADVREPIERYHRTAMEVCEMLLRAMALSLELDEHHFEPFHQAPICTLRLLHYPPRPDAAGEADFGAGAHTDWGAVTVLAQDGEGSLQVMTKDGDWADVPPVEGAFVINVGDLLQRWTNDRYVSTLHRVIGVPGRDRYSIACFFDLDHDALIEVLPTCVTEDEPARYGPITAGGHLQERYEASMPTG
ncbi:MAG: 2-oxoglutarate and iron-dependent oxygenase domain-containing protein [Actinomycetota bacterium]